MTPHKIGGTENRADEEKGYFDIFKYPPKRLISQYNLVDFSIYYKF